MGEHEDKLTRRNFLHMVGLAGGSAAVHETLVALGLMRHPSAWAGPPRCDPKLGNGKKVVILGAGIGGLATAYWLGECGYDCTILEAQDRVGGRSYTARKGDVVREEGKPERFCKFDDDESLYVNLGPGRIPYHHVRLMNLCEQLEVPLEVYVHTSDYNLHYMKGTPVPMHRAVERRRIANDTQGYVAELLAKAINQNALDQELLDGDRERLLDLLQKFGDLDRRYRYQGSTRAGCLRRPLDVKVSCRSNALDALKPLGLDVLLKSRFWDPCRVGAPAEDCQPGSYQHGFYQIKEELWQTTSFQPVGGMDRIVHALAAKIGDGRITRGAVVTEIAFAEGGKQVEITYTHNSTPHVKAFDYCVSNIPLPVLKGIRTFDFSPEVQSAVNNRKFSNACKVGWQANRRFWELDHGIYGGISWIEHPITQMWYPSNDYFSKKGVLTGAYNYADTAKAFGKLTHEERIKSAYEGGALLHPDAFDGSDTVPKSKGISIAWQNVPFQKGCSAIWNSSIRQDELDYERLLVPDMNQLFYFVGDQVSTLPGWQEGALMSAEHVVGQITRGVDLDLEKIRREVESAPMSLELMG